MFKWMLEKSRNRFVPVKAPQREKKSESKNDFAFYPSVGDGDEDFDYGLEQFLEDEDEDEEDYDDD